MIEQHALYFRQYSIFIYISYHLKLIQSLRCNWCSHASIARNHIQLINLPPSSTVVRRMPQATYIDTNRELTELVYFESQTAFN